MTTVIYRAAALTDVEVRADGRTLVGTVTPYLTETRIGSYVESFARGAFADLDSANVPLLVAHRRAELPIGHATSLRDEAERLAGEFTLSETRDADEVLALARDGVPLGLCVGFVPAVDRWTADRRKVVRVRASLAEVSVVGVPAYADATVNDVRAEQDASRLPLLQLALRRR